MCATPLLHAQTGGALQIVSTATYQLGPVSPDSQAAAVGSDLSLSTARSNSGQPLPYLLAGTSVAIVDSQGVSRPAALFFASPNQVNFLVPPETMSGLAQVSVSRSDGDPVSGTVRIEPAVPGLYSADGTGRGTAASETLRMDGQVFLFLYGTGIRSAKSVEVSANGQNVAVLFAGPEGDSPGLDQINVEIPESLITDEPIQLVLKADGQGSNPVTVAIQ